MNDNELYSEVLDAAENGDVQELEQLLRAPNAKRILNRGWLGLVSRVRLSVY